VPLKDPKGHVLQGFFEYLRTDPGGKRVTKGSNRSSVLILTIIALVNRDTFVASVSNLKRVAQRPEHATGLRKQKKRKRKKELSMVLNHTLWDC
jgi:hypothetical protein